MTNSTNRQNVGRGTRNVNPFSNRSTLAATRTANTRNQQSRVRGGVVTPPHPNDPVTSRWNTSGLAAQEDERLLESAYRSVQQLEDENFYQSIMNTAIQNGRQTGRSSLFESSPYSFFRDPQAGVRIRDMVESSPTTARRTVVLPRPELNRDWLTLSMDEADLAVRDTVQRNNAAARDTNRTTVRVGVDGITTDFTGPIGFNNAGRITQEDPRMINTPVEPRVGGLGRTPTWNWGDVRAVPPAELTEGNVRGGVSGSTIGQSSSTFSFEHPINKKTLVEILKNEYELKIDARKYGDRMEFKISLFNNTTKEEVLSAEDYVEMDN